MKSLVRASFALGVLTAGPAIAADLDLSPIYKVAPVVHYTWTGFYLGGHGGGDQFSKDWSAPRTATNGATGCLVIVCGLSAGGHDSSSWLAGVQAGYNYQISWAVFGVEAEYSWTKLSGSNPNAAELPLFVPIFGTFFDSSKTDNIGTVAARFGIAFDQAFFFLKGGAAFAHDQFSVANGAVVQQALTENRWGWVIGVGVEYGFFDNWSVKLEYDHLDFGTRRETLQPLCTGGILCTPFDYDIRQTVEVIKVGLNYRFSWGPVVARY
jgi:outer membrane immunogenic protein